MPGGDTRVKSQCNVQVDGTRPLGEPDGLTVFVMSNKSVRSELFFHEVQFSLN